MHLTNYSVDDDFDIDQRSRRSLQSLFEKLKEEKQDVETLWKDIQVNEFFC